MCANGPLELTLAIIKPHIIKAPHALEGIRNIILENRFFVIKSERILITKEQVELFYEEHKERFFYHRLTSFMTSGDSDVHILARQDAIKEWRKLMGPTKVYQTLYSQPDSIRGQYGLTDTRNATHGSDSPESVKREISIFFPDFSISKWLEENEEHFLNGVVKFKDDEFVHTVGDQKACMIQ